MKNKQNVKFIFMAMLFLSIILLSSKVHAASLSISPSKNSATVGESVNVTIFGDDIQGNVSVSASGADLNVSSVYINNNSATVTATMTNSGTVTVSARATDIDVVSQEGTKFSDEKSCSLTVAENTPPQSDQPSQETQNDDNSQDNKEEKKSSDANLVNLGIRPHDFPGFKPGQLSYNAEVPNDTEEVEVYAKVKDSKAKVQGTGTKKLKVGKNALDVVVTAEDGTKKTYTINVTRLEAEEEEENTTEEQVVEENPVEVATSNLTKLEVEGLNISPVFSPDIYEYTLTVNKDVTQLNVITEGANENIKIEVVGNTDLQEGENIVTILAYNEENEQTDTYQIIVTKNNEEAVAATAPINEQMQKARKIRYIILGAFIIFVLACVIGIIMLRRKFSENESYDDEYDDEYYDNSNKEDTYNLSNDDELFNRVNKNDFYRKEASIPYVNRKTKTNINLEEKLKYNKAEMPENKPKEINKMREQNNPYEDEKIALRRERQIKRELQSERENVSKPQPKKIDFETKLRDDFTVQPKKQDNKELKEKTNKKENIENTSSELDNFYAMDNLEEFLRAQKEKNRK